MADKFLNTTGLNYYHNRIKTIFADKTELDALDDKVDGIIAEGGEPNTIESISVNGTVVNPDASKNVALTIPTATSDLTNDGDGVSNFATEEYVAQNGGKIDIIKVNGATQTITQKTVDITVPTKTSDITNDSDFQTSTQVQALIDSELEGITGIDFQVVDTLPATGVKGTIYLLHNGGSASDIYDEYIWVIPTTGDPHWEQIGTTAVDLSDYWSMTDLTAITTAEIDEILGA